jgi:cell division protein FtsI/penicillin-binding protein 2/cell division protein FtsW (lipid II flippase)
MFATRSWETTVSVELRDRSTEKPRERRTEFVWLLAASLLVACGLALVFIAKTHDFQDSRARLNANELLNLNAVLSPDQVAPVLEAIPAPDARQTAASTLTNFLVSHRPIANVGAIAHLHLGLPIAKIKPLVVVRTPPEWIQAWALWMGVYFAAFWFVHFAWHALKFRGDPVILPALHLLTGIGLILMVSLRDPLRDTLEFKKFAVGVALGCAILLLPLLRIFQYQRWSHWVYTPLLLSFALFAALLRFGSGPTGSDAKVNLGPFQPVEIIKILLVLFIAGYLARNWERLRDLQQRALVPRGLRWLEIPRLSHSLPVMVAVSCALILFFVLKDMGPALVLGFVFLTGFAIARKRAGLALLGVALLIAGVIVGYRIGTPHTVVERVSMWLSPWNNDIRGGDQLAHSLWGFATGGPWGSGPGWGDPSVIPAGHTDLVLPSIAEEWGYCGVLAIALLFGVLIARGFRIALRAPDEYGLFLSAGLSILVALEMLLISGGALGAIPLSGVVSPFLSSGNTAMLANFAIMAVLLSVSNQSAKAGRAGSVQEFKPLFGAPVKAVSIAFAVCGVALLIRAASVCVFHADDLLARDAHVFTHDGIKRAEHNPRLNLLAASIPRGDIYDRNGVLLATSSWEDLEQHRAEFAKMGIDVDQVCSKFESRHYPFGPALVHFLGDLRTGEKFHATNASLVEHDANTRLQGYRDYAELATVVRYRHQLENPKLQALLRRDRDIHTTIDVRLQTKAVSILQERLAAAGKKGAIVVMNAGTGELLTEASWPVPPASGEGSPDELLDRARYGEYPPGSTFKLVTAMAALRLDPHAASNTYTCRGLGDGRVGTIIPGWRRPIRDDIRDHAHGTLNMANAIAVSCNAYFAQLGVFAVGSKALQETANMLGISVGTDAQLRQMLPFASYGQGEVVATPFKMARVAATIADNGSMPQGRWILNSDARSAPLLPVLAPDSAAFLQRAMRSVVTSGTARSAMAGLDVDLAGKTGTAQLNSGQPHSWFAGFAPYDGPPDQRIAFAVVVEHGGYGALTAAPIARQLLESAKQLGLLGPSATSALTEIKQ